MAEIDIEPGGPMVVRDVPLGRLVHEGDRWRTEAVATQATYRLCRCGTSSTMPFCDRIDGVPCFEEEAADPAAPAPGPFTWDVPDPAGPPAIALKPGGPVRVAGEVRITYGGAPQIGRDRWSLCRCGASRCQPVCDSTHKITGFEG